MSTCRRSSRDSRRRSSAVFTGVALLCTTLLPLAATAASLQSLDAVRQAAEQLIEAQLPAAETAGRSVIITAGYLDPRLRLARCEGTLVASRPTGPALGARSTVAVSCRQGADWTVHVPVMVESEGPVLVTRRAMTRGEPFVAADVEVQTRRVAGLAAHYVNDVRDLAGRHAKRSLPPGTALSNDQLATDLLVKRGQQVTLLAAVGGIEVRALGKALTDGGVTERVRVQNLNSARIVEGQVESADTVRIAP